ncbi:MAG TPA: D-alanine--D-alanine ligase [Solirubrobacteraceae bacterium]|jgi:D-alanine-D-alanine ligase|nr:D-alanine--D-alanine ligase [Solirubrobacteraceae bacterium]
MPTRELTVGVAFGGRSVEHDVSIITGLQALAVLEERHRPLPIYIARSGRWFTGDALRDLTVYQSDPQSPGPAGGDPDAQEVTFDLHGGRLLHAPEPGGLLRGRRAGGRGSQSIELDAVVLATHGTQGEDGCLQGALELAQLPYVGPGVGAAAAAMDKVATKAILAQAGLPALPGLALRREQWDADREACRSRVAEAFSYPLYVKPASLGSSVGVSRCEQEAALTEALELAFELDRVCLVEPAAAGGIEVNCAVIGRPGASPRASVCEQPLTSGGPLSFEDKYMRSGKAQGMKSAERLIPAPISAELTARVQELACAAFTAFGCAGVTRVDFLIDAQENVYVNELNTIPGSFAFYLWEPAGLPFAALMDDLLDLALAEHAERRRTTTVFDTNLLALRAPGAKAGGKA